MNLIRTLLLTFTIAFTPLAQGAGSDCTEALTTPGISFPSELKLNPEKVQFLLQTEEHQGVVRALGNLFYRLENHPEIFFRLPYILNTQTSLKHPPPNLIPEVRALLMTLDSEHQRNFSTRLLQMNSLLENNYLSEEQIQWLALLVSDLPVMPYLQSEFKAQSLKDRAENTDQKLEVLDQRLRFFPKHREFFDAMLTQYGIFHEIPDIEGLLHGLFAEGGIKYNSHYEEQIRSTRESLAGLIETAEEFFGGPPSLRRKMSYLTFRGAVSMLIFKPGVNLASRVYGLDFMQRPTDEVFTLGKEFFLATMEDLYFRTDLKRFNHKAYMDVMEFIFFGTPIPYSQDQIYDAMVNASKRLLLPAKNHITQLQAKQDREYQARLREVVHSSSVHVTPFVRKVEEAVQAHASPKREKKSQWKKSERTKTETIAPKATPMAQPDAPLPGAHTLRSFSKYAAARVPLSELVANTDYELMFLRDPKQSVQKIRFLPEALVQMTENPAEAVQVIDGILIGFTNRTFHGAGMKRLHAKMMKTGEPLYEARPNRVPYRMILRKHENTWIVEAFVSKTDFTHEVERVRGAL